MPSPIGARPLKDSDGQVDEEVRLSYSASRRNGLPDLYSTRTCSSASSTPSATRSEMFDAESPMADPPFSPITPPNEFENPFAGESATLHSRSSTEQGAYRAKVTQAIAIRSRTNSSDSSPKLQRGRPRKIQPPPSESGTTSSSINKRPSLVLHPLSAPKAAPESQGHVEATRTETESQLPRPISPNYRTAEASETAAAGDPPQFVAYRSQERTSARSVNSAIYECIKKNQKIPRKKEKAGYIYLLELGDHIKIGKTFRDPAVREEEWEKCKIPLVEIQDTHRNAFKHHGIVEALLLREFMKERKQYKCASPCGKKHVEWVEAKEDVVLRSLNRWRNWIIFQQPFDRDWKLTPYWSWAVQCIETQLNDVDWDQWTQPGITDRFWFELDQFDQFYKLGIVHHFKRKDLCFCLVGLIILLITYISSGGFAAASAFIGLLAL